MIHATTKPWGWNAICNLLDAFNEAKKTAGLPAVTPWKPATSGGAPVATLAALPFYYYTTTTGLLAFDADGTGGTAAINLVTLLEQPGITAAILVIGGW